MKQSSDEKIKAYIDLLLKWQKSVNLISPKTIGEVEQRHIKDSLQLAKFIPADTPAIIDIGSGAGLPGIPLAITTGIKTFLIESDRKKALFMEESIRQIGLDAYVINERIENARIMNNDSNQIKSSANININTFDSEENPAPVIITARALSELKNLFELLHSFLEKNSITKYRLLLLKGKNVSRETEEAEKYWNFEARLEKSETEADSSIVIIEKFYRL